MISVLLAWTVSSRVAETQLSALASQLLAPSMKKAGFCPRARDLCSILRRMALGSIPDYGNAVLVKFELSDRGSVYGIEARDGKYFGSRG